MALAKGTYELFCELKKIIPGIPDRTRSLSIHLDLKSVPLIKCEFFATVNGEQELLNKTFEIVEKESDVTECPRASAEATGNTNGSCPTA